MFAVAFALSALSPPDEVEQQAFVELLRVFTGARHVPFDRARAERLGAGLFPAGDGEVNGDPGALVEAVRAFTGEAVPFAALVARFRQLGDAIARESIAPVPETRLTLERVASLRVPSAILCNGWGRIAQTKAASAGYTGPVLVSEEVAAAKPARAAFEALIAEIRLPADRIWYIGTDPRRDIDAAVRAGLRAFWLNRPGEPYPVGIAVPFGTIHRLDQILPELCEEYTRSLLGLRYVLHSALAWREGHFVPGVEYGLNDPSTSRTL
jgi:phosphoglycolate phosphatase-like HAD superfamily hydrolase